MDFKAYQKQTIIRNPNEKVAEKSIPSEIRIDPLTGRSSRICHFMKLQWDKPDFEQMIAGTEKHCPFCKEAVLKVTPCFPEALIPGGRLVSGEMVLFPNIAPYDSLGAVATLGHRHYIPMTAIGKDHITRALHFVMDFFRRVDASGHPESVYHIVNWNYMPPAGSSLIHPHLQVFSTSFAPNLMRMELAASKSYAHIHGSNYWDDLAGVESIKGDRFLGQIGRTAWMTAYAPMGVAGDILAVVKDVSATLHLTDTDLEDLSDGLTRAMAAYDKIGIYSFNMNFFTGAADDDHTRFHLLFSPRTFFNQTLGTPDVGALRNLFNETLCMAYPEEIARMLRPEFERG